MKSGSKPSGRGLKPSRCCAASIKSWSNCLRRANRPDNESSPAKWCENKDKILSFYEREVRVIVRKKAGAEVEFGNTLLLGENPQGLILDWELFKETAPADSRLQERSRKRMKGAFGSVLRTWERTADFIARLTRRPWPRTVFTTECVRAHPMNLKSAATPGNSRSCSVGARKPRREWRLLRMCFSASRSEAKVMNTGR